ncbi:MAG: Gfo/Idh/MocA family oxidoreductase, partial [Oscillospiraceae bacterium]
LAEEKALEGEHVYCDLAEMLEQENIDVLDVCTPSYLHKEHSIAAMERGIHVLCEKPAALSAADAAEMYSTAKKNHVKLMIAHVIRFSKEYLILKEIYESQKYGKLLSGRFWRLSLLPTWSYENWMMDEGKSGLVPYDLHIHDLDFIYSMLGEPKNISAVRNGGFDCYSAQYDYDGCTIFAEAAWYDNSCYPFKPGFNVCFEKAVLSFDGGLIAYTENDIINYSEQAAMQNTGINITSTDGYFEEMLYFKNCIANDREPEVIKENEVVNVLKILENGINNAKINCGI